MLELYIPPGSNDGDRIVLAGEADQHPQEAEPGDIAFTLHEQPHVRFRRSGADLAATLRVTLAEALCGFERVVITTLDRRGLRLDHTKPRGGVLRPGQTLRVEGEGMPIKRSEHRGDLYLEVEVEFPPDDWLQDVSRTAKLEGLLPRPRPLIEAETVDEVEVDAEASMEEFGSTEKGQDHSAWQDEDEEDGAGEAQCAQQ